MSKTTGPHYSAYRVSDDGIRFGFADAEGHDLMVALTQEQVDSYRDVLDKFSTVPLRKVPGNE